MKFGENFTFYRKKLGITQEEIAERLFVSRQTVSRWENGAVVPDVETLIRICEIFDCDMDMLVRKDASRADDINNKKNSQDLPSYNPEYDRHMNRYAFYIALGVALILLGVTILVFLGAYPAFELLSVVILFAFIFSAVAIFILFGIGHTAFMRENPFVLPYPSDKVKAFSKRLPWFVIIATGLIIVGLIFIIITNYDDNCIPTGFDKTVWEHISAGIFLLAVTVAVFLYVYSGILYSKYNVNEYNEQCIKEGFYSTNETGKIKKNKRINDAVCSVIMLCSTALFMIFGFFFNAWHPAWAFFPIGAICCGIFSVVYDAMKK